MIAEVAPAQVLSMFQEARTRLKFASPLDQSSVKPVVIFTVDLAIGLRYGQLKPLPWLMANRTEISETAAVLLNTRHYPRESIVDVAVYKGETDPYETLATAESEAWCQHEASSTSTSDSSDYLYDLYKLLQLPSPFRLFVARVSTLERCRILEKRIAFMRKCYRKDMREGDQAFSIVLPTAKRDYEAAQCLGWVCGPKGTVRAI